MDKEHVIIINMKNSGEPLTSATRSIIDAVHASMESSLVAINTQTTRLDRVSKIHGLLNGLLRVDLEQARLYVAGFFETSPLATQIIESVSKVRKSVNDSLTPFGLRLGHEAEVPSAGLVNIRAGHKISVNSPAMKEKMYIAHPEFEFPFPLEGEVIIARSLIQYHRFDSKDWAVLAHGLVVPSTFDLRDSSVFQEVPISCLDGVYSNSLFAI